MIDEAVKRSVDGQRLLAEASGELAKATDEQTALDNLGRLVVPSFADGFSVHLLTSEGDIRQMVSALSNERSLDPLQLALRNRPVDPSGKQAVANVMRSGQSAFLPDVEAALGGGQTFHELDLAILRDGHIRSVMIVPVVARSQTLGTSSFVITDLTRQFDRSDLSLAQDLAGRIGLAVDNLRLLARERSAREEIAALYDATKHITASLDLPSTLGSILDAAVKLSGSSGATISLLDPTGTILTIEARGGTDFGSATGFVLPREAIDAQVAATGEVFVSTDLIQDPRWVVLPDSHPEAIRSGMFVPMKVAGRVIGVLAAWSSDIGYFTSTHQRLMQGFTEQAALAVQRARDLQQHRFLEEQLRQSQKMEAIGQLAGGVAHDFNNLLTVIMGYAEMLRLRTPSQSEEYDEIHEIILATESATALTSQLLAFSRRQIITLRDTNLNNVIEKLGRMLRRVIGEDIAFVTHLRPGIGTVRVDSGQIEQLLVNLAANARDAMPTGGSLTIETRNIELSDEYVLSHPDARIGPHVLISISDTGIGMSSETKARIFEPFFTTKEVGRGTGLGLAAVYGAIAQSGGSVDVQSVPGRGTTFELYFPVVTSEGPVVNRPTNCLRPPDAGGNETVLLVEDEDSVRALARVALQRRGHIVLEANGGEQAFELEANHPGPIQILIADVVMPGLGGRAVVEYLVARRPAMKVLFVSGHTNDVIVRHGVIDDRVDFLQKPYLPSTLTLKVREILDRP